jgi:hypothetical protein
VRRHTREERVSHLGDGKKEVGVQWATTPRQRGNRALGWASAWQGESGQHRMLAVTKQARPHDQFSFPWIYEYTDLCQKARPHDQFSFPWIYEYTDLCHFFATPNHYTIFNINQTYFYWYGHGWWLMTCLFELIIHLDYIILIILSNYIEMIH